ncbi:MAG: hypothetical protein HY304_04890 [candidate division Zixibacteria bacterium]|nr:hypothetical protein [candidate division Zixibacteria bacterium]
MYLSRGQSAIAGAVGVAHNPNAGTAAEFSLGASLGATFDPSISLGATWFRGPANITGGFDADALGFGIEFHALKEYFTNAPQPLVSVGLRNDHFHAGPNQLPYQLRATIFSSWAGIGIYYIPASRSNINLVPFLGVTRIWSQSLDKNDDGSVTSTQFSASVGFAPSHPKRSSFFVQPGLAVIDKRVFVSLYAGVIDIVSRGESGQSRNVL